MYRNYLVAALRNLARNRLYAAINIVGLAVGFAAALLIALFVRDELSYDRWMPGYEQVYLADTLTTMTNRAPTDFPVTNSLIADFLKLDFPEIQTVARFCPDIAGLKHGDIEANENIAFADPGLFDVLPFPVIAGDPATALSQPNSIVLTRRMALKYFGRERPLGEMIELNYTGFTSPEHKHLMQVTAVLEDPPTNSQLDPEIVISGRAAFSPLTEEETRPIDARRSHLFVMTYVRFAKGTAFESIRARLPEFSKKHMANGEYQGITYVESIGLVPLAAVHLYPTPFLVSEDRPSGNRNTISALSAVGLLIVFIASVNFVNLMTARAARRAIEIGIRKVSGASRWNLIVQFIGESLIYAMFGMILALATVELSLPAFNGFLGRAISFDYWQDPDLAAAILGLVVIVGVVAGAYPAFVLSEFRPAAALKGAIHTSGAGSIRQALVVLQFAILIGIILTTTIIHWQTVYAMSEGMRLAKDQILVVRGKGGCTDIFKSEIRRLPGVEGAACSMYTPMNTGSSSSSLSSAQGIFVQARFDIVDFDFFELFGLHPLAGRFFLQNRPADAVSNETMLTRQPPIVINETLAHKLGFASPEAAIGQTVSWSRMLAFKTGRSSTEMLPSEIIGVVPDFSLNTVRDAIPPAFFYVDPGNRFNLSIKLKGRDIPETLRAIDGLWKLLGDGSPISRIFVDQRFQALYFDIIREGQLFSAFSGVALFISCLGLFGLSAFTAERRTKEIGIRKAMGAGDWDIVGLLLWQFAKPVLWANLIAWPVGWYFMDRWLHGFALHVDLSPWVFIISGAAALLIALLTVSTHTYLVARAKPAGALKYE